MEIKMNPKEYTLIDNNGECDDWNILALVKLSKEEVIEQMQKFFRLTINYKIINPTYVYGKLNPHTVEVLQYSEFNFKGWFDNLNYYWQNYYVGSGITKDSFIPIDENDVKKAPQIINRQEFVDWLSDKGIEVIKEEDLEII
jgi:hypothetical protein